MLIPSPASECWGKFIPPDLVMNLSLPIKNALKADTDLDQTKLRIFWLIILFLYPGLLLVINVSLYRTFITKHTEHPLIIHSSQSH